MSHGKEERITHLFDQYQFQCQCEACTNDWPIYASLELDELFIRYINIYYAIKGYSICILLFIHLGTYDLTYFLMYLS